jgi:hypothetical protein
LTCRVVDTKRVDAKRRASGGAEQVVADVSGTANVKAGRPGPRRGFKRGWLSYEGGVGEA